jgi:hypothetical protein
MHGYRCLTNICNGIMDLQCPEPVTSPIELIWLFQGVSNPMTAKPYADIRKALVDGIRNDPGKSDRLKRAAEILIGVIDSGAPAEAFQHAYAIFTRAAGNEPFPPELSPAEIAKAFGLGGTHQ